MKLITKSGKEKDIILNKFGAMEGWELQRQFVEFAISKNPEERIAYTMQVLSFASINIAGAEPIPLKTKALIENHLESWEGIREVFNAILMDNGIDPNTHAEKEHYWAHAGGELATAFIAQTVELMGPILANQINKE